VNFHVNFNVLLSKYIVHLLVKIKKTLIITSCTVQLWKKKDIQVVYEFSSNLPHNNTTV
jgi:hypothetical protein